MSFMEKKYYFTQILFRAVFVSGTRGLSKRKDFMQNTASSATVGTGQVTPLPDTFKWLKLSTS